MTKTLKFCLRVLEVLGNIFLAGLGVYCHMNTEGADPLQSAFTVGVIVAMWNFFIICLSHIENEEEKK